MNEKETREILDNMSEQEFNDFIFFCIKRSRKGKSKIKNRAEKER